MTFAKGIEVPIHSDYVLTPTVIYADELTGIYFRTADEQYGRITFENLDAIKICRGEHLPYPDDWTENKEVCWIYKVEDSAWQTERYLYEKANYGSSYEFGGNVEDMITDFSHYIFQFHDQFVEVIARGFWYEKDSESLIGKPLQDNHPFHTLSNENCSFLTVRGLTCEVRRSQKTEEELLQDAQFCSQRLIDFSLQLGDSNSVENSLYLSYRNNKPISILRGYFGREAVCFEGIATFEQVRFYIEQYMLEVYERRKQMNL